MNACTHTHTHTHTFTQLHLNHSAGAAATSVQKKPSPRPKNTAADCRKSSVCVCVCVGPGPGRLNNNVNGLMWWGLSWERCRFAPSAVLHQGKPHRQTSRLPPGLPLSSSTALFSSSLPLWSSICFPLTPPHYHLCTSQPFFYQFFARSLVRFLALTPLGHFHICVSANCNHKSQSIINRLPSSADLHALSSFCLAHLQLFEPFDFETPLASQHISFC